VPAPVVLLHGFAGTARHWGHVLAALPSDHVEAITPALADAEPLTPDGVATLLAASAPEPFTLAGYSMGGRLALHAALAHPGRVARLVLVSTSAGIENAAERAQRKAADDLLADEIERATISSFVERWARVPLFADDPAWVKEEVAADERRCDPVVLARCLRNLGPGTMAPMWERLGELTMPVAVLAGQRDSAYVALGRRLAERIDGASFTAVPDAGHRVALEAPEAVAMALGSG
jgi:2-succinyl-6-hydroxy-2,4-cyclohexadiene-1-carboxylate synthase